MKEKQYNFTEEEVAKAKTATITYPAFGTLLMEIKEVKNGTVEGLVWQEEGYYQYNMPEDYHGEYEYMNFPISCIRFLN